jgi:MipA family protein
LVVAAVAWVEITDEFMLQHIWRVYSIQNQAPNAKCAILFKWSIAMKSIVRIISIALFAAATPLTYAQVAEEPVEKSERLPLWELGGFGVAISQQAYPGADQQANRAIALPFLVYRGEFLRADRGSAGIRAIKTPTYEVDIGVAGSFGSNSDDIDARRGMPDLGTLVEFGPRLKWNIGDGPGGGRWRAEFPVRGVFDISDDGKYRGAAFEPRLVFERVANAGWRYSTSVSAIVADKKLAETFYGVAPAFATPERAAYQAKSGLIAWRLAASFSRNINRDVRLFGFARIDTVSGAANDGSPLVKKDTGGSVGVGIAYTWRRSSKLAGD